MLTLCQLYHIVRNLREQNKGEWNKKVDVLNDDSVGHPTQFNVVGWGWVAVNLGYLFTDGPTLLIDPYIGRRRPK